MGEGPVNYVHIFKMIDLFCRHSFKPNKNKSIYFMWIKWIWTKIIFQNKWSFFEYNLHRFKQTENFQMPFLTQAHANVQVARTNRAVERWNLTETTQPKITSATPRSEILSAPSVVSSRFPGLMSLWTIPWLCKYSRPSISWQKYLQKATTEKKR